MTGALFEVKELVSLGWIIKNWKNTVLCLKSSMPEFITSCYMVMNSRGQDSEEIFHMKMEVT